MRDKFFGTPIDVDAAPVMEWIVNSDGRMVIGGKLLRELERKDTARRFLAQLIRAGKAVRHSDLQVDREEQELVKSRRSKSDDPHVIALALVSGARLLYSEDRDLHEDFKNPDLLSRPRGSIYQNPSHAGLLQHCRTCGFAKIARGKRGK